MLSQPVGEKTMIQQEELDRVLSKTAAKSRGNDSISPVP